MPYMFWERKNEVLASLPLNLVEKDMRRWMTDELASDYGIDAKEIVVKIKKVNL